MTTTRVGVDGHVLDGKYQGTRTWLLEILRRAPALAPDLTFVVYTADPQRAADLIGVDGIEHVRVPAGGPVRRNLVGWPRVLRRDNLDLLLTQYFSPPRHTSHQVVVIHDVLFETHPSFFPTRTRWRNQVLVRWSARRAGTVVTVSEYSRQQITRQYGRPEHEISIVHNGVDVDEATRPGQLPDGAPAVLPFALVVGRLEPRKNLRLVLDALERVEDPEIRVVVVGRDDFEDPEVLTRLAAERRVTHLGDVTPDELRELYRRAAVLLYPSLGEGWGIPVLEALAAGTPVVASDATAIPEAGGSSCTYFSPTGADAAARLAELLVAGVRRELPFDRDAARAHVRSFSWDRSATELVAALRRARRG